MRKVIVMGIRKVFIMEKWFKVLSKNLKAKDGGKFDYAPFVKSKKWVPLIKDKKLCERGYHVTRYWNMFFDSKDCRVFEVEVKGLVEEADIVGVCEKAVCSSLKIVSEFIPEFKDNLNTGNWNTGDSNTGDSNTGNWNTGDSNTGNWNTGYRNTGNWNTGYRNTGDRNTGNWNTGNWNTGDSNTGYRNTGDSNTGDRNTGNWNTGDRNTGYSNTGNWNTGYRNTGNWNTGNWNTGSFHVGAFNTKDAEIVYLFDKQIKKTDYDRIKFPNYFYFDLGKDYKKSWAKSFANASKEEKEATIKLPNFDFKVFEEITGITKKMLLKKKEEKKEEAKS
jgi:hypothetical protein